MLPDRTSNSEWLFSKSLAPREEAWRCGLAEVAWLKESFSSFKIKFLDVWVNRSVQFSVTQQHWSTTMLQSLSTVT